MFHIQESRIQIYTERGHCKDEGLDWGDVFNTPQNSVDGSVHTGGRRGQGADSAQQVCCLDSRLPVSSTVRPCLLSNPPRKQRHLASLGLGWEEAETGSANHLVEVVPRSTEPWMLMVSAFFLPPHGSMDSLLFPGVTHQISELALRPASGSASGRIKTA